MTFHLFIMVQRSDTFPIFLFLLIHSVVCFVFAFFVLYIWSSAPSPFTPRRRRCSLPISSRLSQLKLPFYSMYILLKIFANWDRIFTVSYLRGIMSLFDSEYIEKSAQRTFLTPVSRPWTLRRFVRVTQTQDTFLQGIQINSVLRMYLHTYVCIYVNLYITGIRSALIKCD